MKITFKEFVDLITQILQAHNSLRKEIFIAYPTIVMPNNFPLPRYEFNNGCMYQMVELVDYINCLDAEAIQKELNV